MDKFKIIISISLILIITFAAFFPSLHNGFTNWDDDIYVTKNPLIKDLTWSGVKRIFASAGYKDLQSPQAYVPLVFLSYALEYRFFKLNALAYHTTNLIFHLLNCLLVFWLIFLLSRSTWAAFIVAILFGVHPLRVESVAWITERKDVLCAFFFLIASICYIYYQKQKGKKYYYLAVAIFILALLSKPLAIALPFVLLFYDYSIHGRISKNNFLEKIIFFGITFGYLAIYMLRLKAYIGTGPTGAFSDNILLAIYGVIFYLYKLMLPLKLSCLYQHPLEIPNSLPAVLLLCPLIAIILLFLVLFSRKYTKKVILGSVFFLITIFPALLAVPSHIIVADRFAYLPSIGIFFIVAEGFIWLYRKKIKYFRLKQAFLLIALVWIIGILSSLTWRRCQAWKDSPTLWNDVVNNYPGIATAYAKRGEYFWEKGENEKARSEFIRAIDLSSKYRYIPWHKFYYLNLGNLLVAMGRNSEATAAFEQLSKRDPKDAVGYVNLAVMNEKVGNKNEAIELLKKALEINPKSVVPYYYLGILYDNLNRKEEAKEMLKKVIEIVPTHELAYVNLARIYKSMGKEEELAALYKKAVSNDINFLDAYFYMGNLYSDMNRKKEAIRLYKRAIQIDPKAFEIYANLGGLYCALGKNREAIKWLKKALELNPSLAVAHNNIAVAYYYEGQYGLAKNHYDKALALGYQVKPELVKLLKQHHIDK